MNKPTYEELERALAVLVVRDLSDNDKVDQMSDVAFSFYHSLTEDDFSKTAEVVSYVTRTVVEVPE